MLIDFRTVKLVAAALWQISVDLGEGARVLSCQAAWMTFGRVEHDLAIIYSDVNHGKREGD
jgi:hypothetical protein